MLRFLWWQMVRAMSLAGLLVLAVAWLASAVRLLPWLLSASVPWGATAAFVKVLLLSSVEAALVVAPPVGAAVATARLVSNGSSRTLQTLGMGPSRQAAHAAIAACMLGALVAAGSFFWGEQASAPGRVSNQLVQGARPAECSSTTSSVPLVGASWLCEGGRPLLTGVLGLSSAPAAVWRAADAAFDDGLTQVRLTDLTVVLRSSRVTVQVEQAVIVGFDPWLSMSGASAFHRGLACALAAVMSSTAAAWVLAHRNCRSMVTATVVGLAGPCVFLLGAEPLLAVFGAWGLGALVMFCITVALLLGLVLTSRWLLESLSGGTKTRSSRPPTRLPREAKAAADSE